MALSVQRVEMDTDVPVDHELLTVPQFAARVHRDRRTVYTWIRTRRMPPGSVVMVHGHLEVDWTVWRQAITKVI